MTGILVWGKALLLKRERISVSWAEICQKMADDLFLLVKILR